MREENLPIRLSISSWLQIGVRLIILININFLLSLVLIKCLHKMFTRLKPIYTLIDYFAGYNAFREYCGFGRAYTFDDLSGTITDPANRANLQKMYK